ncbi:30S ribosomal protein S16 [Candidatus Daviesbacteria bacterium]|nr:30S ribosomal protein S16 [Candidatus Daviesbacteria bacterium]
MLKIRLMRIGAKKKPFYRVVVLDERAKRTGAYIELLGTYNPLTEPKDIKLVQDRIDHWIKQGAQLSTGFLRIIGKAPQRPPRKPKKEKKTEEPSAVSDQTSEKKAQEEEPVEEVVGEETKSKLERPEEAKSEEQKAEEDVILGSEATPESKDDAGQASMTENKPEESEKKDEGSA